MLAEQFHAAAAAAKTTVAVDEIARLTWRAHAEGQLQDAEAEAVSASLQARRRQAMSGIVPAKIAASFTMAELAVLTIIGRQCQRTGVCVLPVDANRKFRASKDPPQPRSAQGNDRLRL